MPIVSARCPNCNGDITVDNTKDAGICNYCGNPFIVEKAINHYHNHYNVTNNYNADVINTYSGGYSAGSPYKGTAMPGRWELQRCKKILRKGS